MCFLLLKFRKQNQNILIHNCDNGKKWTHKGANHFPGASSFSLVLIESEGLPQWLSGKEPAFPMQKMWVWSLGWEDPLEEEMVTYFSILPWRVPWTEESGRLQFMGSQRVRHDWAHRLAKAQGINKVRHVRWRAIIKGIRGYKSFGGTVSHPILSDEGVAMLKLERYLDFLIQSIIGQRSKQTFLQRRHTDG